MNVLQNFYKLSAKKRSAWIFALIIIFAFVVFLISGGNYYNRFVDTLAKKTNDIVVLPSMKEYNFNLGLDLQGGTQLIYEADMSSIEESARADAVESARDIIERRVNTFGVSEPLVQANKGKSGEYRIIVELAGIKDVDEAIKMIGETPILEFKEQNKEALQSLIEQEVAVEEGETDGAPVELSEDGELVLDADLNLDLDEADIWQEAKLTGKYLRRASLQFNPNGGIPEVALQFNDEGAEIFAEMTGRNIGEPIAIFLDGNLIKMPIVNDRISDGQAVISGQFSVNEAKELVKRLNSGALPVPISLVSQKTVEASLGAQSVSNSLQAGLLGILLTSLFMIIVYRLPGLLSVFSLAVYGLSMLAIFKAMPIALAILVVLFMIALIFYTFNELGILDGFLIFLFAIIGILLAFFAINAITLSLSGIAGLVLSLGMAVDANILIFARTKEEIKRGASINAAIEQGFRRAWPSIRDGNITVLITCLILIFFGTSSIQGFGTTLFIGVSVSLFSAIVVTRSLLLLVAGKWLENKSFLFGVKKGKINS